MENTGDWDRENVIIELTQGRELARQLHIHLNLPSSSHETRELLVLSILTSYDKTLSMLKWSGMVAGERSTIGVVAEISDSPRFLSASPRSKDSDGDFKDPENEDADRDSRDPENKDTDTDSRDPENEDADRDFRDPENKNVSRKRKSQPQCRVHVKVCTELQTESVDDGYIWRKYGEKAILGAIYPRGYYRCTHRNVQGCLATKQIQRSNDDPTILEITYRGVHTCTLNPDPNQSQDHHQQNQQQEKLSDLEMTDHLIKMTEKQYTYEPAFPSFSFPSTSVNKPDNFEFLPSLLHNHPAGPQINFSFPSVLDNLLPWEIPSVSTISSSVGSLSV